MLSYQDLSKNFGLNLFDKDFQLFLRNTFSDLTEYNVLESNYITSVKAGIELGFKNKGAVYDDDDNILFEKGNPIFSHFTLFPKSVTLINRLPFQANFADKRFEIINKAGSPFQTKEGYANFLNKNFLVDNYKVDDIAIAFDYDVEKQTINFIQIRDNNLAEHLKL
jgi:hypothetical protein